MKGRKPNTVTRLMDTSRLEALDQGEIKIQHEIKLDILLPERLWVLHCHRWMHLQRLWWTFQTHPESIDYS